MLGGNCSAILTPQISGVGFLHWGQVKFVFCWSRAVWDIHDEQKVQPQERRRGKCPAGQIGENVNYSCSQKKHYEHSCRVHLTLLLKHGGMYIHGSKQCVGWTVCTYLYHMAGHSYHTGELRSRHWPPFSRQHLSWQAQATGHTTGQGIVELRSLWLYRGKPIKYWLWQPLTSRSFGVELARMGSGLELIRVSQLLWWTSLVESTINHGYCSVLSTRWASMYSSLLGCFTTSTDRSSISGLWQRKRSGC